MDFFQLLQQFGVAVACLAALGWGVWRALRWGAEQILSPLVSAHIDFIQQLQANVERNIESLDRNTGATEDLVHRLNAVCRLRPDNDRKL